MCLGTSQAYFLRGCVNRFQRLNSVNQGILTLFYLEVLRNSNHCGPIFYFFASVDVLHTINQDTNRKLWYEEVNIRVSKVLVMSPRRLMNS